jgi:hypothetical protein
LTLSEQESRFEAPAGEVSVPAGERNLMMNRFAAAFLAGVLLAGLVTIGAPLAPTALATCSTCAETFDGTSYTGTEKDFAQGTSVANLGTISWNDVISSMKVMDQVGHGFIWYTGSDYTGSSFKTCGTDSLPTLTYNNEISSVLATTNCPS